MEKDRLNLFWDSIAEYYPHKVSLVYSTKKAFDRSLVSDSYNGSNLLDAGCGSGYDLVYFQNLGFDVTGVDFSSAMCSKAIRTLSVYGLQNKIDIKQADLRELHFEDNTFDVITCFSVIDHLPTNQDRRRALQELLRVAKPQAQIVITVPNAISLIGWIIHPELHNELQSYLLNIAPRSRGKHEYVEVFDSAATWQQSNVINYQWEHYFHEQELSEYISNIGAAVKTVKTGVLSDPQIVFNERQLLKALEAEAQYLDHEAKQGVFLVRVSTSEIELLIEKQIIKWEQIQPAKRGFRLGIVAIKEA